MVMAMLLGMCYQLTFNQFLASLVNPLCRKMSKVLLFNLPFAQSLASIVNFKLLIERPVQPQSLQDVLLQG
jgi:hypothetical protein